MKRLTVIIAHQDYDNSIANKTIVQELEKAFPEAYFHDLFARYPDFQIDVEKEQQLLLNSDMIVFQFPIWWYNMPAILKQWFDMVWTHNFAYGSQGDKLKDKYFLASATAGGNQDSYSPIGYNHFRVEDFFHNMEQTAYLAQMIYIPTIFGYANVYIPGIYNTPESVQAQAKEQAGRLIDTIREYMQ